MEDSLRLLQQTIISLKPKPTELDLLIRSSGLEHEAYSSTLVKIEQAVHSLPIDSRHNVYNIVIEWLTRKTSETWAVCCEALRKDYKRRKYQPIGYSPIG